MRGFFIPNKVSIFPAAKQFKHMGLFNRKKVMVIVDTNDVPIDPAMRKKVKFKGKVKQTKQMALGCGIILFILLLAFVGSVLLWESIK